MLVDSKLVRWKMFRLPSRTNTIALILFLLLALLPKPKLYGQIYEAGLMAGSSFYIGDLRPYMNPGDLFQDNRFAGGFLLRYHHNQHVALRLNMLWANIAGHETNSSYIIDGGNYSFNTSIYELSLQGEINFLPFTPGDEETRFTPYIFAGTGGFYYSLTPSGVHDAESAIDQNFLIGIGFKLNLSANTTAGIEWGMRSAWTDDLDYSQQISPAGNPKSNDWYSFAGISISYKFLDRSRPPCPLRFQ